MGTNITPKVSKSNVSLAIAFTAIGFAEYYDLCTLFWISAVFGVVTTIIQITILVKYVANYYKNKE